MNWYYNMKNYTYYIGKTRPVKCSDIYQHKDLALLHTIKITKRNVRYASALTTTDKPFERNKRSQKNILGTINNVNNFKVYYSRKVIKKLRRSIRTLIGSSITTSKKAIKSINSQMPLSLIDHPLPHVNVSVFCFKI